MTARTREDELKEVPLWKANKELWPPGVREIDIEEQDCLGIDTATFTGTAGQSKSDTFCSRLGKRPGR